MSSYQRDTASKVALFKHPLHPMLVSFPIAFLSAAFLTDLGFWRTGDLFWAQASFWLLSLGLLTGLLAALAGMIDFFAVVPASTHTAGWLHLIINVIALALAALNVTLRVEQPAAYVLFFGLILSTLTAGLLVIGGWFGGELTFRHRIGVFGGQEEL